MKIKIAERLRPYSHTPGVRLMEDIQVFPTRLVCSGKETLFDVKGPVKNFMVELNLERGEIKIISGKFRHSIPFVMHCKERLSLGNSKAQDWDLVKRRQDLTEILPIWLRLASLQPETPYKPTAGTLIETCAHCDKTEVVPAFLNLFNAGFRGILSPRLFDDDYQGLAPIAADLSFFKESGRLIRALFLQETDDTISLLPKLPPEFHSGRFLTETIDIEWTKKLLRRAIIRPSSFATKKTHPPKTDQTVPP